MAGSGISTTGISSTAVKHPPKSSTEVGYIYLWQAPPPPPPPTKKKNTSGILT